MKSLHILPALFALLLPGCVSHSGAALEQTSTTSASPAATASPCTSDPVQAETTAEGKQEAPSAPRNKVDLQNVHIVYRKFLREYALALKTHLESKGVARIGLYPSEKDGFAYAGVPFPTSGTRISIDQDDELSWRDRNAKEFKPSFAEPDTLEPYRDAPCHIHILLLGLEPDEFVECFSRQVEPHTSIPHVDDGDSSSVPPDMLRCIPGVSGMGSPTAAEIDSMMEARLLQKN